MRIAVIQFSEIPQEAGILQALERAELQSERVTWQEARSGLLEFDGFVVAGNFDYEHSKRLSFLAALSAWLPALIQASAQGKPILGLGNGARVLIEGGLVPGVEEDKLSLALTDHPPPNRFSSVRLAENYQHNAFTRFLTPHTTLPLRDDQESNYFIIPKALRLEMEVNGLDLFHYCNAAGEQTEEIAAVSNKAGHVLAFFPIVAIDALVLSMKDYLLTHANQKVRALYYYPRPDELKQWMGQGKQWIIPIDSKEHQSAVNQLGYQANVRCYRYLEGPDSQPDNYSAVDLPSGRYFLIVPKKELMTSSSRQGLLWRVDADEAVIKKILVSNVVFHPLLEDCYIFNPAGLCGTS